jgi:hypothetical protein
VASEILSPDTEVIRAPKLTHQDNGCVDVILKNKDECRKLSTMSKI